MASYEDAAVGWEIYRQFRGEVSRIQLNQAIRERGNQPIAQRTFEHYEKLARLGYSEYVSINRLDIRHANDSIFTVSDRSRYQDRVVPGAVLLVLPLATRTIELVGSLVSVSEGYATIRVPNSVEAVRAANATKYNKGVLVFQEVGVERAVVVAESLPDGDEVSLVLEFRSLLETDVFFPASAGEVISNRLSMDLGAEASVYRLLGAFHRTFDLYESMRGFVDLAAISTVGGKAGQPVPSLRVRELRFRNPFEIYVTVAVSVAVGVRVVLVETVRLIEQALDVASKAQGVRHEKSAELRRSDLHKVELESRQLDNVKKAIETARLYDSLKADLPQISNTRFSSLSLPVQNHLEALKNTAAEAATEMQLDSGQTLEIHEGEPED